MKKVLTSQVLGKITQDESFDDWWLSNPTEIPFFDNHKLIVTFIGYEPAEDAPFIEDADQALRNFLKLNSTERAAISPLAHKAFTDYYEIAEWDGADELLEAINKKNDIWHFIHPTDIYVSRRHRRDEDIYVQVTCNCDWDDEHGLLFVFRQGKKLTRLSDQDGHLTEADAYDKPDAEDELLSKY